MVEEEEKEELELLDKPRRDGEARDAFAATRLSKLHQPHLDRDGSGQK